MIRFTIIFNILWIYVLINVNHACKKIQLNNNTHMNLRLSPVCLTSSCNDAASRISRNINESIDPCDNFYQFACGGFIPRLINISDEETNVSLFDELKNNTFSQLKTIIEKPISLNESKSVQIIKKIYNICMNTTGIENQGIDTLLKNFETLGGWPVIDGNKWNETNFDLIELIYKSRELGYSMNYFFQLKVEEDAKNTSRYALYLNHPGLDFLLKYLIRGRNDSNVEVYYKFMVDIAVMLGADRKRAEIELEETLNFEIKLANISLFNEQQRNVSYMYNAISLSDLMKNYACIPWKEYMNTFFPHRSTVSDNEFIIVESPHFLPELEKLITTTPNRILANYALWKITEDSILYLHEKIRQVQLDYFKLMYGIVENKSRWSECLEIVKNQLGIALGAFYIRNYPIENNIISEVTEIIIGIKKEFKNLLKTVEWMDNETKKKARNKITAITAHISYPDELLDDEIVENYYKHLELNNNDLLECFLNINRFKMDHQLSLLGTPVDETNWMQLANIVDPNAYYYLLKNSIQITASILRSELFQYDRPKYLNYGAIGSIIGHELTHALDDVGNQYDKHGNMVDWWDPMTKKRFIEKAQCIINQYSNYSIEEIGMKLNGFNNQGENIADNGGMKIAYLAYTNWLEKNKKYELSLNGLSYNPKQLFWIAAANNLCSRRQSNNLKYLIIASSHSPEEYRIINTFSNLQDFSKDFHCPEKSKMNPVNKCIIW